MAILIADDDMAMCLILRRWVERLGLTCVIANNGAEAVGAAKAKSYDVVFMDVCMPVMNGCEACVHIRRESKENIHPYIVGMISIDDIATRQQCLASGMKEVLCKPLNQKSFKEVVFRAGIQANGACAGSINAPEFDGNYHLPCSCPIAASYSVEPGSRHPSNCLG
jgi:CheY-like chemotaxis protein